MVQINRGEVYYVDLDPTQGSEMQKKRPAVVVSNDTINKYASVVVVCPITDAIHKSTPFHILLPKNEAGMKKDSIVHCGQVRAVDKTRLSKKLGAVSPTTLEKIDSGLRLVLSLP